MRLTVFLSVLLGFFGVMCASASADTLVVLNKSDNTASVIDANTLKVVRTVRVGNAPHEAAVSPDGTTVVVGNYGDREERGQTLSVFRLDKLGKARTIDLLEYHRPHGIIFFEDGERVLVTAETENALLVVNVGTGEVERVLDTKQRVSHMAAMTADERYAIAANLGDGTATVIDLAGERESAVIETGAGAEGVAVRPGTNEVWVTNRSADTLSVIDLERMKVVAEMDCGIFPIRIAFTPDGERALVSCAESGAVAVVDAGERRIVKRIGMKSRSVDQQERDRRLFGDRFGQSPVPIGILVEPGGKRAYVANTNADVVTVLDLTTFEIAGRLVAGSEPDGLAWSGVVAAR